MVRAGRKGKGTLKPGASSTSGGPALFDYEAQRAQRIAANRQALAQLGLSGEQAIQREISQAISPAKRKSKKRKRTKVASSAPTIPTRRSARVQGLPSVTYTYDDVYHGVGTDPRPRSARPPHTGPGSPSSSSSSFTGDHSHSSIDSGDVPPIPSGKRVRHSATPGPSLGIGTGGGGGRVSSAFITLDLGSVDASIGSKIETTDPPKQSVMQLGAGKTRVMFNRYSGIQFFDNAMFIFINIDSTTYRNDFQGDQVKFYVKQTPQGRMSEERFLRAPRCTPTSTTTTATTATTAAGHVGANGIKQEGGRAPTRTSATTTSSITTSITPASGGQEQGGEAIYLFCRNPKWHARYYNLGRMGLIKANTQAQRQCYTLQLLDYLDIARVLGDLTSYSK